MAIDILSLCSLYYSCLLKFMLCSPNWLVMCDCSKCYTEIPTYEPYHVFVAYKISCYRKSYCILLAWATFGNHLSHSCHFASIFMVLITFSHSSKAVLVFRLDYFSEHLFFLRPSDSDGDFTAIISSCLTSYRGTHLLTLKNNTYMYRAPVILASF